MRVLVAQANETSEEAVASFLSLHASSVDWVYSAAAASTALASRHFDVFVLDLGLSEGDCLSLLEPKFHSITPNVIVLAGSERAGVGFRLAQLGARAVIDKPIDVTSFARAWQDATAVRPDLRPLLRTSVGLVGLRSMEALVRTEMIREALTRSRGSRRGAATMLQISRQLLQYILRNDEPACLAAAESAD